MGEIMGFIDKVKNLFTEPEDPEDEIQIEQIKKEGSKISIEPKPVVEHKIEKNIDLEIEKEPVKDEPIEVEEIPQIEKTQPKIPTREQSKTPIFFTEEEFADLEPEKPKKVEPRRQIESRKPQPKKEEKKQPYSGGYTSTSILTKEKPTFKPTPIISPIYGILDKNYSKEDIVEKKENNSSSSVEKKTNDKFDEVRNKAYGRNKLENELEKTLYEEPKKSNTNKKKIEEEIDLFDELENENLNKELKLSDTTELAKTVTEQEKNIRELEEVTMDLTKELDNLLLKRETYSQKKDKIMQDDELLTENEVFNFIDSIYEDGRE